MSFLKKIFGKKDDSINSYEDFWNWFQKNEQSFYKVVKEKGNIEKDFFEILAPKLDQLKEDYFYLTGMLDENTAELILTPDGVIKNIVFVEGLVEAAPVINNWKFTALKPASDIKNLGIQMAGYDFSSENISFYPNENSSFPDKIDITIIHNDLNEDNEDVVLNGCYIFLDNFLGELNFATTIDDLTMAGKDTATQELIPIKKLKDFLIWREKEFLEKYEGTRNYTEKDSFSLLKAKLKNGNPLIAVINADLLEWDRKASHPWISVVILKYDGEEHNGMPDTETSELMNQIEDEILLELKDSDGYLNIGRQTANSEREVYFACKDFRKPSKVLYSFEQKYADKIDLSYDIYKDKYWESFEQFRKR